MRGKARDGGGREIRERKGERDWGGGGRESGKERESEREKERESDR